MIALTGAAGFIGRNLAWRLAARDEKLLAVELSERLDEVTRITGRNTGSIEAETFLTQLSAGKFNAVHTIVHLGARTDTTDPDDAGMLDTNYRYARDLMDTAVARGIRFIYTSSAAVYGNVSQDENALAREAPLNVYGFSKWLLDRHARRHLDANHSQLSGIRPFNVYGPHEAHKGHMASMVHQLSRQLDTTGRMKIFGAGEGCDAGEQARDFVHVDDLCAVLIWLVDQPHVSGLFDVGSGTSSSFNELARHLISARGGGETEYIPFPDQLRGRYQTATCADLGALRAAGFRPGFIPLDEGIRRYLTWHDVATPVPAVA